MSYIALTKNRCFAKILLKKLRRKARKILIFFRIEIPEQNDELHCIPLNLKYKHDLS